MATTRDDWDDRVGEAIGELEDGADRESLIDGLVDEGWSEEDAIALIEEAEGAVEQDDEPPRRSRKPRTQLDEVLEIARELRAGARPEALVERLIDDGWREDDALDLIDDAAEALERGGAIRRELELVELLGLDPSKRAADSLVGTTVAMPDVERVPGPYLRARLAVTLGLVIAFLAGHFIPTPVIDLTAFGPPGESIVSGSLGQLLSMISRVSPLSLGLLPFINAALFIEVIVLVFLPGRNRDPDFRSTMTRATVLIGAALAALQSFGLSLYLESLSPQALAVDPGVPFLSISMLGITAGSCLCLVAANAITRWGVGNGFAVLFAADLLLEAALSAPDVVDALANETLAPGGLLTSALAVAAIVVAMVWVLTRFALGSDRLALQVPTCGLAPMTVAVAFPAALGSAAVLLPPLGPLAEDFPQNPLLVTVLDLAVAISLALLLSALFYRRWRRGQADPGTALAWRRAVVVSALLVVALVLCEVLLVGYFPAIPLLALSVGRIVIVTAIGLDLVREIRARLAAGDGEGRGLVPLACCHDVPDALEAFERLRASRPGPAAAGPRLPYGQASAVPLVIQGFFFRSLAYVFAPYVPLVILGARDPGRIRGPAR